MGPKPRLVFFSFFIDFSTPCLVKTVWIETKGLVRWEGTNPYNISKSATFSFENDDLLIFKHSSKAHYAAND